MLVTINCEKEQAVPIGRKPAGGESRGNEGSCHRSKVVDTCFHVEIVSEVAFANRALHGCLIKVLGSLFYSPMLTIFYSTGGGIFRVGDKRDPKADPPALWSSLILAIDNLLLGEIITRTQATGLRELVQKRDMRVAEAFVDLKGQPAEAVAEGLVPLLDQKAQAGIHVIHVCTELAPVAQAGTLAAEVMGLCR